MKRFFLYSILVCIALFSGCNKDNPVPSKPLDPTVEPVQPNSEPTPLKDGAIKFSNPDGMELDNDINDEYPEAISSQSGGGISASGLKATEEGIDLKVNEYRFKLVAQKEQLVVNGQRVQATHVKITDIVNNVGYAYVSYNKKLVPNIGGLIVYKFTVKPGPLETATVDVEPWGPMLEMPQAQINAIDFDGVNIYIAGASDDLLLFGKDVVREDPAFFMVLELDANKKLKEQEPVVKQLTSYQATSICKKDNRIYITAGNGMVEDENGNYIEDTGNGGFFIYSANDYKFITSVLDKNHARGIDVDGKNIYLYQAEPARVTKYDMDAQNAVPIYNGNDETMQRYAKSDILSWGDYLFIAQNETGLKMLNKNGGIHQALDQPNKDGCVGNRPVNGDYPDGYSYEEDVTNSMSVNSDKKIAWYKDWSGKDIQAENVSSNLLLLANGEQGIYWYDVTQPINGTSDSKYYIASSGVNSILASPSKDYSGDGGASANYVTSKGNVVFVAQGVGGLKVLYIGFNIADAPPPPIGTGCDKFMDYLWNGTNSVTMLFPESNSVFTSSNPIIQALFQSATPPNPPLGKGSIQAKDASINYIEILEDNTELYITYMGEGAGYSNALGYFVIPANTSNELTYYNSFKNNLWTKSGTANVLKDEYTIFQNITDVSEGGHMQSGNMYVIQDKFGKNGVPQKFNRGDKVVIFMVPNGWTAQNNRVQKNATTANKAGIFFMHKDFNEAEGIIYGSNYGDYKYCQIATFYSADCRSLVLCIEDIANGSDCDFNDIIFSISDNTSGERVTKFKAPKYAVGQEVDEDGNYLSTPDKLIWLESSKLSEVFYKPN